jgi:hypothetical protein
VISVVISPLLEALGAGLGRADASPTFRRVTVPRELNPEPVTTTKSSTEAVDGVIVIDGLWIAKSVDDPMICPTVAVTMWVPGGNEPPAVAAGTSMLSENAPAESVRIPPLGIAVAVPIVKVDIVVLGGKELPVNVMNCPVEADRGSIVMVPLGTLTVTSFVLLDAFTPPATAPVSARV